MIALPWRVRIRSRKPWVRFRRRLFGWNVLFTGSIRASGRLRSPQRKTLRQPPKFQRRNTLLKSSAAVKVAKRVGSPSRQALGYGCEFHLFLPLAPRLLTRVQLQTQLSNHGGEGGIRVVSRHVTSGVFWHPRASARLAGFESHLFLAPLSSAGNVQLGSSMNSWRRGWDSNPRTA